MTPFILPMATNRRLALGLGLKTPQRQLRCCPELPHRRYVKTSQVCRVLPGFGHGELLAWVIRSKCERCELDDPWAHGKTLSSCERIQLLKCLTSRFGLIR